MNKIFAVFGTTGEYSDHRKWAVRGFETEVEANDFMNKLVDWCRENNCWMQTSENTVFDYLLINPYDPNFSCNYTGTDYFVVEIPFGAEQ